MNFVLFSSRPLCVGLWQQPAMESMGQSGLKGLSHHLSLLRSASEGMGVCSSSVVKAEGSAQQVVAGEGQASLLMSKRIGLLLRNTS